MKKIQKKLGRKVLLLIIGASSILTFIFTIISFAIDFKNEKDQMNKVFYFIENTNLASVAEAIFALDEDQIETQGLGILNHQDVESVLIKNDQDITVFTSDEIKKKADEKNKPEYMAIVNLLPIEGYKEKRIFELFHEDLGDKVGKITVVLSKDNMYKRLSEKLIVFFITQFIKTMIISTIILIIFRTVVTQHLEKMASFLKNVHNNDNESMRILTLSRKESNHEDEIDILLSAINEMYSEAWQTKKSILENISQAILIIKDDMEVCPGYSPFSHTILELHEIKHIKFEKILSKTSMQESEIKQVVQTLHTCIGETNSTFELNKHHLPLKIDYNNDISKNKKKILEISWDSILDKSGNVSKILVSMKDITSMQTLEDEFKSMDYETKILKELAQTNVRNFDRFQNDANIFLHRCERALKNYDYKKLFILLHTFRGTVQTLGLKEIGNCIFDIESYFNEVQNLENTKGNIEEINKIRDSLIFYGDVYQKYFIRDENYQSQYFQIKESKLSDYPSNVKVYFQHLNSYFDVYLNKKNSVDNLIEDIKDYAKEISENLNKCNPIINLAGGEIVLKKSLYKKIDEILNHLIKNSIDHGIESPGIRSEKNKSKRGVIEIGFRIDNGYLKINYSDDGAGINIEKLRKNSQDYNSLDEKVAQYIFDFKVSTAKKLTEISGRGVGMTAVKSIVDSENGSIEIVLKEGEKVSFRQFLLLISIPFQNSQLAKVSELVKNPHSI